LCADGTSEQISQRLIDFANNSGGADNISVYIIKVGSDAVKRDIDEEKTIPTPISLNFAKAKKSAGKKKTLLPVREPLSRAKIVNICLLSLLVLVLFSGVFYLINRGKDGADDPEVALLSSPTSELPAALPDDPTIPTQDATPTNETDDPLLLPTEPTNSIDLTQTAAPTSEETPTGSPEYKCVYQIQPGDQISTIYKKFDLIYAKYEEFSRHSDCNLGQLTCSKAEETYEIGATIQPGWFLIIPEVNEETCKLGEDDSYWIYVNP